MPPLETTSRHQLKTFPLLIIRTCFRCKTIEI